jgi:Ca2+-binding EF-hand superfamily protein
LELRKVFDEIDKTEDGVISYDEFEAAMKKTKLPLEELHAIFDSIDVNRTGHIMYTEFIAAALHAHG